MRNLQQLLAGVMLLTAQVAQATSQIATASVGVIDQTVVTSKTNLKLSVASSRAIVVSTKPVANFDTEVLVPLRAAQAAKAEAEAKAKAALARKRTAIKTAVVSVVRYTTGPLSNAQITFLGNCESGMTPTRNSGNGFYGAFQFSISTWNSMGTGFARADLAPLDVQINAVQQLLSRSSIFNQFPGCARKMQTAGLL